MSIEKPPTLEEIKEKYQPQMETSSRGGVLFEAEVWRNEEKEIVYVTPGFGEGVQLPKKQKDSTPEV